MSKSNDQNETQNIDDYVDPLDSVGCPAIFKGSIESFLGLTPNLKDSLGVAKFAASLGMDFRRTDRGTITKMLGPLPAGEFIAFTHPELKHSRHLPSTYFQDSKRISEELTYYANSEDCANSQFVMLTIPALDGLSPIVDFKNAQKVAAKKSNLLRQLLERNEIVEASVVFERLEGEYRAGEKKVFWHLHFIVELEKRDSAFENLTLLLSENSKKLAGNWAGVKIDPIEPRKFGTVAFYCAKPCQLAVQMANAGHKDEFRELVKQLEKRHLIKRWGGFRDFSRHLTKDDLSVSSSRDGAGKECLTLIIKKKLPRGKGTKGLGKPLPPTNEQASNFVDNKDVDFPGEGSHDNSSGENAGEGKAEPLGARTASIKGTGKKALIIEYCGTYGPNPSPSNRLGASLRLKNYTEEAMNSVEGTYCSRSVREAQKVLLRTWEANTGKPYDLKEFLRPIAEVLKRMLVEDDGEQGNIYRTTVTASREITRVLDEIIRIPKAVKRKQKEHRKLPFWKRITKFIADAFKTKTATLLKYLSRPRSLLWVNILKLFVGQTGL